MPKVPSSTRAPAARLVVFFLLVFALTWIVWIPRALVSHGFLQSDLIVELGRGWTYAPAVAALIFLSLTAGRGALADLGRRLVDWRIGWRWYAMAALVPLIVATATAVVHAILGGQFVEGLPQAMSMPLLLIPVILAIRVLTDGVGEEVAWRGVALPGLLEHMNAVAASVVLGVVWALWHLPLIFTGGSAMSGISVPLLLALLPAQAVFYTWIYRRSRGSVLLAALLHGLIGMASSAAPAAEASGRPEIIRVLLWWAVAAVLIARYGRNLGDR